MVLSGSEFSAASTAIAGLQRVNVKNGIDLAEQLGYHIDPTGVADSTAGLQAVAAQSLYKAIYFPDGTYTFNQQVNWASKRVIGNGPGKTVFSIATPLSFALTGLGGTLTLRFNGGAGGNTVLTAAQLISNGTANIQAALEAIPAVGAGNVAISLPFFGGNNAYLIFRIEWKNALGNQSLTASTLTNNLTASATPRAWIAYGQQGDGTHNQVEYLYVALNSDVAAFVVSGDSRLAHHFGYSLNGPGTALLGVQTAGVDGILVQGQPRFDDVSVGGCDSGFRINSATGHVTLVACFARGNFDGLGITMTGNDNFFEDCFFDNNNRSSVAVKTPTTGGLTGVKFLRCHGGFSPFGVFQEIGNTAAPFISDVDFDNFIFEAIGNAAIYSQIASTKAGAIGNLRIYHPEFYFDQPHRVGWYPHDYAVEAQYTDGFIEIDGGNLPFADGAVNTYHFASMTTSGGSTVICRSSNPEDATVDDASQGRFKLFRTQLQYRGTGTLASGQTSVTITMQNVLPANVEGFRGNLASMELSAVPNDPANYGGLTGTQTCVLICSGYVASKVAANTFLVTYKGPALTANLTFAWRLRATMV